MIVSPADSEVAAHFGAGELVMWPALSLVHVDALARLPVHAVEKWKKLKSRDALAPVVAMGAHALSVWTRNTAEARVIQGILIDTQDEIRALVCAWFPSSTLGAELHSWRYTLTENEPVHFDVYADRVQRRVIRVFVNLDTVPRIWDVGPIDDGTDGFFDQVYKARVLKQPPTERIEFAPGSAWIVDSQRFAHAIVYGRRAAMFSFEI